MRSNYCLTILHGSILVVLFLTLEADSEDSECYVKIKVRRNTVYKALLGEDVRINCTVGFCNDSAPTVTWHKLEETIAPVNVNCSSHIKTEWKFLNHSEGLLFLVFQNILRSDSGVYRCLSGGSVGHVIKVFVDGGVEVTWTTSEPESPAIQDTLWPYVYRVVGITVFFITVTAIYVVSKTVCKGRSTDTPDLRRQTSYHALPVVHIYDNDQ